MNGLWRKFFAGSWKVGVFCPHVVRKLWTTVENKCSNRSCTQKMGLGTHFSSTNHEYPVEKKSAMPANAMGKIIKKFHNPWRDCGQKNRRGGSWPSLKLSMAGKVRMWQNVGLRNQWQARILAGWGRVKTLPYSRRRKNLHNPWMDCGENYASFFCSSSSRYFFRTRLIYWETDRQS